MGSFLSTRLTLRKAIGASNYSASGTAALDSDGIGKRRRELLGEAWTIDLKDSAR
jgi:hypothetical protein